MAINTFLVPVDYGEYTESVLRYAVSLARAMSGEIVLLHVVQPPVVPIGQEHSVPAVGYDVLHQSILDNARQYERELLPLLEGLPHRSLVRMGSAAAEIVLVAAQIQASMIIMATHDRSALSRLFLGSTAEAVLRHSPVPVLTVRTAVLAGDKTLSPPVESAPAPI